MVLVILDHPRRAFRGCPARGHRSAIGLLQGVAVVTLTKAAIDAVLRRGEAGVIPRAGAHAIINMSTTLPAYPHGLEADIRSVGGCYVEAPVSGLRKPAEAGQLVEMPAGEVAAIAEVRPLLLPMCRDLIVCCAVPNALAMKLAVNIFLLSTVTGLAVSMHFAERHGLDLNQLALVLNGGQIASDISRVKVPQLVARDFAVHAAIADVLKNNRLIVDAAREAGIASPLTDTCHSLYQQAFDLGHDGAHLVPGRSGVNWDKDAVPAGQEVTPCCDPTGSTPAGMPYREPAGSRRCRRPPHPRQCVLDA
jgi:3-hydroxyisobutyrate dehydrogenase